MEHGDFDGESEDGDKVICGPDGDTDGGDFDDELVAQKMMLAWMPPALSNQMHF